MTLALQGIRVLDITDAVAGPFATMLLAFLGAEVIRVESRRHLGFREGPAAPRRATAGSAGPLVPPEQKAVDSLMSPNFVRFSLDKLSVALNLAKPEGRDIFKKLVRVSDVVVDNFSFGVMQQWGLDYRTLSQIKNDIIVVSMPSLGKGPHERWTTWGMNLLSFTGFAYSWGHPETPMEERSASNYYGDYTAGTKTTSAIIAALYHRAKTGEGQYIEVSQTDATVSLLGPLYLDFFINKRVSPPLGNRHPCFAPYNAYPCKGEDRWCVIAVFNEDEWQQFCSAIGSPDWTQDPRFQSTEARLQNVNELDENIRKWTRQYTPHQVMRILQSAGVAAGAVQNNEDLFFDLQLRSRGHMVEIDTGQNGIITFDGPPLHLSAGQKTRTDCAPRLGEHNDYVYKQLLGLNQQEIAELVQNQVIW